MIVLIVLLIALLLAALWTALAGLLLRAALALALTSALLTIIMFQLNAPYAAAFELSVCAGLISVIFVSVVSLTQRLSPAAKMQLYKHRLTRFWYLPVILLAGGIALSFVQLPQICLPRLGGGLPHPGGILPPSTSTPADVRTILWDMRRLDLFGQVVILLAGSYAVIILFKEEKT
jgi:NADH-quinone oxidoreductase subunit J